MKLHWRTYKGRLHGTVPARAGRRGPCSVVIGKRDGEYSWSAGCSINPDGSGYAYPASGEARTLAQAKRAAMVEVRKLSARSAEHYRRGR